MPLQDIPLAVWGPILVLLGVVITAFVTLFTQRNVGRNAIRADGEYTSKRLIESRMETERLYRLYVAEREQNILREQEDEARDDELQTLRETLNALQRSATGGSGATGATP